MTTYNPGPWKLEIDKQKGICSVINYNGQSITDDEDYYPCDFSPATRELIAAAPKMFVLLPKLKAKLTSYHWLLKELKLGVWNAQLDEIVELIEQIETIQSGIND